MYSPAKFSHLKTKFTSKNSNPQLLMVLPNMDTHLKKLYQVFGITVLIAKCNHGINSSPIQDGFRSSIHPQSKFSVPRTTKNNLGQYVNEVNNTTSIGYYLGTPQSKTMPLLCTNQKAITNPNWTCNEETKNHKTTEKNTV